MENPRQFESAIGTNFAIESKADANAAPAPAARVVGRVREQGSRLPIAGAQVVLAELGIEVRTDSRGQFEITEVNPGEYPIEGTLGAAPE